MKKKDLNIHLKTFNLFTCCQLGLYASEFPVHFCIEEKG